MSGPVVRVAALQLRPPTDHPDAGRERLVELLVDAGEADVRLAVAPELATSAYLWPSPQEALRVAEPALGPTCRAVAQVARRNDMAVVYGFVERADGRLYNAANVIGRDGRLVGTYRKVDLFVADTWWAQPGTRRMLLEDPGLWDGVVAPAICKDLVDDTFVGWLKEERPHVLPFPTSWVPAGEDVHGYWLGRLAGWDGLFIAADRWGVERGVPFAGLSMIAAGGEILAAAPEEGDGLIVAEVALG